MPGMSSVFGWTDRDSGVVLVVEAGDMPPNFAASRDADGNWADALGKGWTGAALAEFDAIGDKGAVRTLLNEARMALSSEPVRAK
jgi:hypothetical protein